MSPTALVLENRRTFSAPIARVFEAFANPALLKAWAAPGEHVVEWVEIDFRVGGVYKRGMRFPDGVLHIAVGTFTDITPPIRLAYSFSWETLPEFGMSAVAIELKAVAGGTEVVVRHSGVPAEIQGAFDEGWKSCLEKLGAVVG
jgi:uncharacterized protein YndB with AHSA1/START domain